MVEERVDKAEKDIDRLWNEIKLNNVRTSQFETAMQSISVELHEMKNNETLKAIERTEMKNDVKEVNGKLDRLIDVFDNHTVEEMAAYDKMRKVITIIGVVLVALVIDNQAGTNIVGSIWHWGLSALFGINQ